MSAERTAISYGPGVTSASRSVLVELMTALGAYRDALILIGGWAPYFLLERHQRPDDPFAHVGSIDIDLVVDPRRVGDPQYATIVELLRARGYRPALGRRGREIPFSFERTVLSPATEKPYTIRVDFLTRLDPDGSDGPHLEVQDALFARKLAGCEAAFDHHTMIELTGVLPDGGEHTVPMRMADVVGCLTMKGIVLGERYREKDAYDIYALAAHYGSGPAAAAEAVRPHRDRALVAEAVGRIARAFASRNATGPAWVAAFLLNPMFAEAYQRQVTDAFMVVHEFTRLLSAPRPAPERT
ncbi:MAG TPA: nucleotidyl transferase AbiEii/AbiGii toxin family protein [bacterium]